MEELVNHQQRTELVFRSCTLKQMKLLKCTKTTFLAEGLPLHQQNSFFLVLRNSASIYKYLYTCCIGPDTYSLTDLFLLYATLFSPPEFLNFVSHTWAHFRKPCMCSSLTNNPRSPIATSNLSKSNWDKKATFKKKIIGQCCRTSPGTGRLSFIPSIFLIRPWHNSRPVSC